jgi:uncharacterized integral membrane protein (TIGR00698 family)
MSSLLKHIYPGVLLSLIIASLAWFLGQTLPLIGSSVIALGLGLALNLVLPKSRGPLNGGLRFSSKTVLRLAIILLGSSLSVTEIFEVGRYSLSVMVFTLTAAFGFGYIFGRLFKVNWKMTSLISAGTGVCGGSAIAALSPVIDADDSDVTYAVGATFIFDIAMIIAFPIMGRALGLSDLAYGLWAGTAVNDTSSVVAAGYAFSEAAGDFATIVKLTRTLSIIPIVLIFSVFGAAAHKGKGREPKEGSRWAYLKGMVPWFILWFLIFAAINSLGLIPMQMGAGLKATSRFLMTMALGAIGLSTDMRKLKIAGFRPMLLGLVISTIVVIVSLVVQYALGLL